ncbi:MAG TPA: hypothetical protein VIO33_11465 [Burkholderiaceae bacterium]
MKLILSQFAQLLTALLALYAVALAASLLLVPHDDVGDRLNTMNAGTSLYITEPKYVFMARSRLNSSADKAILLGASNMGAGFRQAQVQARVPALEVHNLAVGGSNIGQVAQIVELVREVQSPTARQHDIYVIGLWYGLFADDKARWHTPDRHAGDTDIDIERYRYGFYRRTEAGPVPLLPPQHLDLGVLLTRPYLVLDKEARDLTASLRELLGTKKRVLTDAQRNAAVIDVAQQRKYLAFWRDYTDEAETVSDASIATLERIVGTILADGGRVVLVDMPIPRWHAEGSALAADYRRRIGATLAHLRGRPGLAVLNMSDAMPDDEFSDEIHPKPRVTEAWAQRLGEVLNNELAMQAAQAAQATQAVPAPGMSAAQQSASVR